MTNFMLLSSFASSSSLADIGANLTGVWEGQGFSFFLFDNLANIGSKSSYLLLY